MSRFRFLTAGESHGKGLTVIIEGLPAGLRLTEEHIAGDLRRRQGGYGRSQRMQIEEDRAEILSGVRHGATMGSPIALLLQNRDWANWQDVMNIAAPAGEKIPALTQPRPGHADLAGVTKYGLTDIRPVLERSSARETAARVAAGAVARRFAEELGIEIHSHTAAIGGRWANAEWPVDWELVEKSPVRCADSGAEKAMMAVIDEAASSGDSVGGVFEVIATGVPVGLGSHVHWDRRLDGRIAQVMMSINSVKAVEIGAGFRIADCWGSQAQDTIERADRPPYQWGHVTNHAGGIEGGISNSEPIVVRAAVKPVPTLRRPLPSIDLSTGQPTEAHVERSDTCVVPAAGVIGEAMMAIVLAEAILEKFGGDNLEETQRNYQSYLASIKRLG